MSKNPEQSSGKRAKPRSYALAIGGIFLALFFIIWTLVAFSHSITSMDSSLEIFLNSHGTPIVTSLMVGASLYGREYFWVPVVAIMLVLGKQDVKILAVELIILFIIGIFSGELLKLLFFRDRPFIALGSAITVPKGVPLDTDSSFPSGHAIIVSVGASFIVWKFFKRSTRARTVSILLALEAAIVCYSRLYNGVHFPLDVTAGIFFGSAVTLLCGATIEMYFRAGLLKLAQLAHYITRTLLHIPEVI